MHALLWGGGTCWTRTACFWFKPKLSDEAGRWNRNTDTTYAAREQCNTWMGSIEWESGFVPTNNGALWSRYSLLEESGTQAVAYFETAFNSWYPTKHLWSNPCIQTPIHDQDVQLAVNPNFPNKLSILTHCLPHLSRYFSTIVFSVPNLILLCSASASMRSKIC